MTKLLNKFRRDEDGAVTVDWVVLTAAIVGLAIAIVSVVFAGAEAYGSTISGALGSGTVGT